MTNTSYLFCCQGAQLVPGSCSCVPRSQLIPVIVGPDSAAEETLSCLVSFHPVLESWNRSIHLDRRILKCCTAAPVLTQPLLGLCMTFSSPCAPLLPVEPLPALSHKGPSDSGAFAPDVSSVFSLFPPVHLSSWIATIQCSFLRGLT